MTVIIFTIDRRCYTNIIFSSTLYNSYAIAKQMKYSVPTLRFPLYPIFETLRISGVIQRRALSFYQCKKLTITYSPENQTHNRCVSRQTECRCGTVDLTRKYTSYYCKHAHNIVIIQTRLF